MSVLVTAEYGIDGTELRCWISDYVDDPGTAVRDAVAAGARWVRVIPDKEGER